MNYVIKSDKLTVTVSDKGAELISAVGADGFEYIWTADERYWDSHSPVLFPACGRILNCYYLYKGKKYDMGCHGFASNCTFEATRVEESALTLQLRANEETKAIYPFDFILTADFEVSGDNLSATFTVKNEGEEALPYMFGWHPGFMLDSEGGSAIGDFSLKFDDVKKVAWHPLQNGPFVRPVGEDYEIKNSEYDLNEEEIYANDTMIFVGTKDHALLSSPKEKHAVDMSWSKNLPYFCIWKETDSNARFICLEPWSDVPNDGVTEENFDTRKMSRLAPGGAEAYSYKVRFLNK